MIDESYWPLSVIMMGLLNPEDREYLDKVEQLEDTLNDYASLVLGSREKTYTKGYKHIDARHYAHTDFDMYEQVLEQAFYIALQRNYTEDLKSETFFVLGLISVIPSFSTTGQIEISFKDVMDYIKYHPLKKQLTRAVLLSQQTYELIWREDIWDTPAVISLTNAALTKAAPARELRKNRFFLMCISSSDIFVKALNGVYPIDRVLYFRKDNLTHNLWSAVSSLSDEAVTKLSDGSEDSAEHLKCLAYKMPGYYDRDALAFLRKLDSKDIIDMFHASWNGNMFEKFEKDFNELRIQIHLNSDPTLKQAIESLPSDWTEKMMGAFS